MSFANILSPDIALLGIIFSVAIDAIILHGALNGSVSHGSIEKLSMPLALFLLILLMYKAIIWIM